MKLQNYNTNTLTLCRAIFALGTLSTLIFNDLSDLLPPKHLDSLKNNPIYITNLNMFTWFDNISISYYGAIVILILTIAGAYPRILCILHALVSFSVFNGMLIIEGGDQICLIISLLLIPICLLDNRFNGWSNNPNLFQKSSLLTINANIAFLFIKIQVAIIYFNAGIAKIYAPEWSNGTAVYYWFNDNIFGAGKIIDTLFGFLFENDYTVTFINWGVIFLELFLGILIFLPKKYKLVGFFLGVTFHFFIILIHGLPTFFLSMLSLLILYTWEIQCPLLNNFDRIKQFLIKLIKRSKYEFQKSFP